MENHGSRQQPFVENIKAADMHDLMLQHHPELPYIFPFRAFRQNNNRGDDSAGDRRK